MGARLIATQPSWGPINKCRGRHQRPLKRYRYINVEGLACRLRARIRRKAGYVVDLGCYGEAPTRVPQRSVRNTTRKGRSAANTFCWRIALTKDAPAAVPGLFHVKRCSSDAEPRWDGNMWFHVKHTFHFLPDRARAGVACSLRSWASRSPRSAPRSGHRPFGHNRGSHPDEP